MKQKIFVFSILMVMFSTVSFAADLLSLVPYDAILVLDINLEKISSQPILKELYQKILPTYDSGEFTSQFEKAGINPYKDFQNVLLFITENEKYGILAEGTFDTITTYDAVDSNEGLKQIYQITSIGGLPALSQEDMPQSIITLVDQRTIAFGDKSVLEEIGKIFNEKENGKSIRKNPNFVYMSNRVDFNKQIWGVFSGDKGWNTPIATPKSGIDNVRMTIFDMDYNDKEFNLSTTLLVARNSELEGLVKSLVELVQGVKGFVATVPGMTKIIDKVEVVDDHNNMARIQLNMPIDQFNAAISEIAEFVEKDEK